MRILRLGLAFTIIFLCACSSRNIYSQMKPVPIVGGWEQKVPDKIFLQERLNAYLPDSGEEFIARGFSSLTVKQLQHAKYSKPIVVEIYQMNSPEGARAIYVGRKGEEGREIQVGEEGRVYIGSLILIEAMSGNRYFRVFTYDSGVKIEEIILVAKTIVEK